MKKTIEVEMRGPLTKAHYTDLQQFLQKHATFNGTKDRILIDYSTLMPDQGIKNRHKDIRLRVTNGIPEMIIKLGSWGGSENRKELAVQGKPGEFDTMVQMFGALGLTRGVLVTTKTSVYTYKGVELAVVAVMGKRYIFEAEILVANEKEVAKARKKLAALLQSLGLRSYVDEEFYAYIEELNNGITEIFDFSNYKEGYFAKRFRLRSQ